MKIIKINRKRASLFIFSFIALFLVLFYNDVNAYQKTKLDLDIRDDFVVEPGRTEVFLNPGETVTRSVSVTNRVNQRVDFSLSTEDFKGSENPDHPVILLGDEVGPYPLKDFIKPEIDNFSLESGEKITFSVDITVPADSEPGGFYGALIISNRPADIESTSESGSEGKTKIVSRIGSLFLVRVNGPVTESGHLSDFKTIESKWFYTERPDGFEILFKNEGNVHLVPYGTIEVKNMFGRTVDLIPVDAYAALPESVRYRQVLWTDGFAFGRYKAELSLYRGYGNEFQEMTEVFWVIPWKIMLIAIIILALISSLIYFVSTRFELKKKDQNGG